MPTKKMKGLPEYTKTGQSMGDGHLDTAHKVAADGKYAGVVPPYNKISTMPSGSSGTKGSNQPVMRSSGYKSASEQRMTTLGTPHIKTKPKK